MQDAVRFETPENVAVTYRLAGPGTRFVSFVFDQLILLGVYILFFAAIIIIVAVSPPLAEEDASVPELTYEMAWGVAGIFIIVLGFIQALYFAVFELFMHGQTPGKRLMQIRVVGEGGFSLTATAILVRNIFRIIDSIPLLWIVPLLAEKTQRFGDMVAGTIVISEQPHKTHSVRDQLLLREPGLARFVFNDSHLSRFQPDDAYAIELFLERRPRLNAEHRNQLAQRLVQTVIERINAEWVVSEDNRENFLEDLFAAYVRRESRELG